MEFGLWEKYYEEILDDFGFSRSGDEESAKLLDEILSVEGCFTLEELREIVSFSDKFIVFGAGPSIKDHIKMLKEDYDLKDYVLLPADGATTALIEERIIPDVIATDLDGNPDDIFLANLKGANVVIHAHADNIDKIASDYIFRQHIGNYTITAYRKPLQLRRIHRRRQGGVSCSCIGCIPNHSGRNGLRQYSNPIFKT